MRVEQSGSEVFKTRTLAAVVLLGALLPAAADESAVRRMIEKLVKAGRRLGASATPTWFLESGERYSGALPLDQVTRLLDKASPAKR